jgi:hypothetical protein
MVILMTALIVTVSMSAYTAVMAEPASAHSTCDTRSGAYHTDWHTIRFHYDYHRYSHYSVWGGSKEVVYRNTTHYYNYSPARC